MKNKKPLYFGSVKINKNYVSFHLMPVYVLPELLLGISLDLKKQMQGKSCFNFKSLNDELLQELKVLTERGFSSYQEAGYAWLNRHTVCLTKNSHWLDYWKTYAIVLLMVTSDGTFANKKEAINSFFSNIPIVRG